MNADFDRLTPEHFLLSIEEALQCELKGFTSAFHSYINRVYEVRTTNDEPLVVKFYRPGRWTSDAILDEHDYLWEAADAGLPVVPPFELANGSTLANHGEIFFAVFPKKRGRDVSFESQEELRQIGTLVARLHMIGATRKASFRSVLHPRILIGEVLDRLADSAFPSYRMFQEFSGICDEIASLAEEAWPEESEDLRLHGDLHRANILSRPDEGLLLIDFDDMLNGPSIQDLWLFLPDTPENSPEAALSLAEGYRMFRDFDDRSFAVVEGLRAMRMLYFLSWCAMQRNDIHFPELFPNWGTEPYWRSEFADLRKQIPAIRSCIRFWTPPAWE